jgi:hypothetical protein
MSYTLYASLHDMCCREVLDAAVRRGLVATWDLARAQRRMYLPLCRSLEVFRALLQMDSTDHCFVYAGRDAGFLLVQLHPLSHDDPTITRLFILSQPSDAYQAYLPVRALRCACPDRRSGPAADVSDVRG